MRVGASTHFLFCYKFWTLKYLFFFLISIDDVINGKPDAPLDTKALSGITFQEDHPWCVDDNELYALHFRTKKLRSVKVPLLFSLYNMSVVINL